MAVPNSGSLSLFGLAKEVQLDNYGNTIPVSSFLQYQVSPISLKNMSTGAGGFDPINQYSLTKPDGFTPHTMSEFRGYDADTPTVLLTGGFATTTANTSGDTMTVSKGISGQQTATFSNFNAATSQQISFSNTIGFAVDPSRVNYFKVSRSGITFQNATLLMYLTAPNGWSFDFHAISSSNSSTNSITQTSSNFNYTGGQTSQAVDSMEVTLSFVVRKDWYQVYLYSLPFSTYSKNETEYDFARINFANNDKTAFGIRNADNDYDFRGALDLKVWNAASNFAEAGWYVLYRPSFNYSTGSTDTAIFRYWDGTQFTFTNEIDASSDHVIDVGNNSAAGDVGYWRGEYTIGTIDSSIYSLDSNWIIKRFTYKNQTTTLWLEKAGVNQTFDSVFQYLTVEVESSGDPSKIVVLTPSNSNTSLSGIDNNYNGNTLVYYSWTNPWIGMYDNNLNSDTLNVSLEFN